MTNAALDRSPHDAAALAVWGFAVSLATLGTATLFDAGAGINAGVFVTCLVIALFAVIRERRGSVGAPTIAAGSWAVLLAFGLAITTDGPRTAILSLATFVLLTIALVTAEDASLDALQPTLALQAPFAALAHVVSGLSSEASGSARTARSPAAMSLVRATLITVPLVTALIFLLAEADPILAAARDALEHIVPDDFGQRAIFFTILLAISLGAYGGVQRGQATPHALASPRGLRVGTLERRTLLFALAATMWVFVVSATISLAKNPAAVAGSGITYAEYVHRGFAELSLAATLVLGATLATRRSWLASDAWARRLAVAAIAGEVGMIAIAFTRVVHYEQAYGFTVLRLYAQGYMIVLACISGLLLFEVVRRAQSIRFAYHSVSAALAVLACCVVWNTDAWIVRHNVDRYAATGKIDLQYLMNELSPDATPEIIASLPRLRDTERAVVTEWLCNYDKRKRTRDRRWFAYNVRAAHDLAARQGWHRATQSSCPQPR